MPELHLRAVVVNTPENIHEADYRTALTLVASRLEALDGTVKQAIGGIGEVKEEVARHGVVLENVEREVRKTNGTVIDHTGRLNALETRNRDADLVAKARREQVEEVKKKAFSLVRALDNKPVTALVMLILVGLGALGQVVWPW